MVKSIDSNDKRGLRGYFQPTLTPLTEDSIKGHLADWVGKSVDDENPEMTTTIASIRDNGIVLKPPGGKLHSCPLQEIIDSDRVIRFWLSRGLAPESADFRNPDPAIGIPGIANSSYAPALAARIRRALCDSLRVPQAQDLSPPPPERVETTISRIIRDTQVANKVKAMHNYECQICGHTIVLADGTRYAEAHHIRPLGPPHDGPDSMENILCVCPNHHAACDLGAIQLCLEQLRQVPGHVVRSVFIDYHNSNIYCRHLGSERRRGQ